MSSPQPTRTEIRREDDEELLGHVALAADGGSLALTVFGGELGVHCDQESAEREVREIGLSSLADRWWIDIGDGWTTCWLIEASPERLVAVIADHPSMAPAQVIPPGTPLRRTAPAHA